MVYHGSFRQDAEAGGTTATFLDAANASAITFLFVLGHLIRETRAKESKAAALLTVYYKQEVSHGSHPGRVQHEFWQGCSNKGLPKQLQLSVSDTKYYARCF